MVATMVTMVNTPDLEWVDLKSDEAVRLKFICRTYKIRVKISGNSAHF